MMLNLFKHLIHKKRVVSTLFLFSFTFFLSCDFKEPQKWETPVWYLPLTIPIIDTEYSFAGMVDSLIIFPDSISNVIQIEFGGEIPNEGEEPLGIPDSIFKISMASDGMELPDLGLGSDAPILINLPDEIEDPVESQVIEMPDAIKTIIEEFGCLPIYYPTSDDRILDQFTLPSIEPIILPITTPDLGIDMFSLNSVVLSEGIWSFGVENNLFFNLDTAKVIVTSGENILFQSDIGPVNSGNTLSDNLEITEDDSMSWNIISFNDPLTAVINIGFDSSQDGNFDCLWNDEAPPFYTCSSPSDGVEAVKIGSEIDCDFDDDGNSDCTGGVSNCLPLYFCGDNGYIGKTGNCESSEYYGDFSAFNLSNLLGISPSPTVYYYTGDMSYHYYDDTCAGLTSPPGICQKVDPNIFDCGSLDCVQGYKEPNSGWDVDTNDSFSLDIDFTNKYDKVRKVNISSTGWDTTIVMNQAFPGFESVQIKQAKIDTVSDDYPNQLLLDMSNGLFADFILQFDFVNFFDETTQDYLSKEFIVPAYNGTLDDTIDFSEKILAYGLPSDQVLDSMVFNITAGIAAGEYAIYAQNNEISVGSPVFNSISMSNLSLQYIEAITDSMDFDGLDSPPISGIPDGFTGFEFYDIIMEFNFKNQIGIPVALNLELSGTKKGDEEGQSINIITAIGAPYGNLYGCQFETIGDTVKTIIRLDKDGQTTEYYCSPAAEEPSCICPGGDCCSSIAEPESASIVDFMNYGPEEIGVGGSVIINGQGILAPGSNIWGSFKLIAPLSFVFSQPINIIPAESTTLDPMDASTSEKIDSSLVEAVLTVNINNSSPLGGELSLLISDSTIFPLFIDSLITGNWDTQLEAERWKTIWDTLQPPILIDSVHFTPIDTSAEEVKALEVEFFEDDSLVFFIGRMFELGFPRSDSIEYNLGYINPDFPEDYSSDLIIDNYRMGWITAEQQRYTISMVSFDKSPIKSVFVDDSNDTTYNFTPQTFQATNFIGVQAYLTLKLNTGGLSRAYNLESIDDE